MKTRLSALACAIAASAFSANSLGQLEAPTTPLGTLARRAGAYLGVLEYLRVFKASDCGYALKRTFPSFDEALANEVSPEFPSDAREELSRSMSSAKPEVLRQAKAYVSDAVAALKRDHDRNTACGLAAGNLASTVGQTYDSWVDEKKRFRVAVNANKAAPDGYVQIFEGDNGMTYFVHPDIAFRTLATEKKRNPLRLAFANVWLQQDASHSATQQAYKCEEPGMSFMVLHSRSGDAYRLDPPVFSARGTAGDTLWRFACARAAASGKR